MNSERNDEVIIILDRPRTLRLGHKALKRFSALTECSMVDMEQEIQHYDKMTALMYVMLSEDDPTLTPEQVDDLLDKQPIKVISAACSDAIEAAFSDKDAEKEEGNGDPQQAAGTGIEA